MWSSDVERDVRKITGTKASRASERRCLTMVQPSMRGMFTSVTMRSGGDSWASRKPSSPSGAVRMSYRPGPSAFSATLSSSGWSSTISSRGTQGAYPGARICATLRIMPKRKKPDEAPMDANDHYNRGLGLMKSIQGPLTSMKLDAKAKKVAADAETSLKNALELADNHGRAHIMLGMLYRYTGVPKKGLPHFKRGMELPPDSDDWLKAC